MTKCECNLESVNHQPGECQRAAHVNALRNGTRLNLCGDCTLPEDTDRRETLQAYAASLWDWMNENQKTGVRFGLFPAELMRNAEDQGYNGRELAVALMDQAQADGGMRA